MRKMLSALKKITLLFQRYLLTGESGFLYSARLYRHNLLGSAEGAAVR